MLRVAHAVFAGVLSADAKVEGCAQRRSEPTQVAARRGEEGEERTVLAGQRVALALLVDLGELGKLQHSTFLRLLLRAKCARSEPLHLRSGTAQP